MYCGLFFVHSCTVLVLCNQVRERREDGHIDRSLQGLRQSPTNLVTSELLYDPGLEEVFITPNKVQGKVFNTGHTATFKVSNNIQETSFTISNPLTMV